MKRYFFTLILFTIICCDNEQETSDCIHPDKIKLDQFCIEIYQPVCGCDLKTYSNTCFAQINGLNEWTEGKCENN
jgi:hypothetical protein